MPPAIPMIIKHKIPVNPRCQPNAQNNNGETPINPAARYSHDAHMVRLLNNGADVTKRNRQD